MRRSRPRSQLARLTVQPGLSDRVYFLGLRALGAAAGGELHPLVFLEAAETVSLDGGVVNEDVGGAVVGGDETVTLVGVEPLHCALSHCASFCCDDLRGRVCGPGLLLRSPCLRKPGSGIYGAAVRTSQAL